MAREVFWIKERASEDIFMGLGECYHLWTQENYEIIFIREDDFKHGMSIIGICAKLFPDVSILTFVMMSNHLHFTCAGKHERILQLFDTIKNTLRKHFRSVGRALNWDEFKARTRKLETLADVRNVIIYNNRNGFVVSDTHTPFTYPWGANRYYFNPDACRLAIEHSEPMHVREIRSTSHSRHADSVKDVMKFDGYALPLSFCDIGKGEGLFRDAVHYFSKISRNIESNAAIAREIGESIFYTDEELFEIISRICHQRFGEHVPSRLKPGEKTEIARIMHFEYNSSSKQIMRILKLPQEILNTLKLK